jgi:hypothetical protein
MFRRTITVGCTTGVSVGFREQSQLKETEGGTKPNTTFVCSDNITQWAKTALRTQLQL